jgi:hypothetical protein
MREAIQHTVRAWPDGKKWDDCLITVKYSLLRGSSTVVRCTMEFEGSLSSTGRSGIVS